jgi:hypothetical protein
MARRERTSKEKGCRYTDKKPNERNLITETPKEQDTSTYIRPNGTTNLNRIPPYETTYKLTQLLSIEIEPAYRQSTNQQRIIYQCMNSAVSQWPKRRKSKTKVTVKPRKHKGYPNGINHCSQPIYLVHLNQHFQNRQSTLAPQINSLNKHKQQALMKIGTIHMKTLRSFTKPTINTDLR